MQRDVVRCAEAGDSSEEPPQNGYGESGLTDLSSGGGEWATFITIDTVVK